MSELSAISPRVDRFLATPRAVFVAATLAMALCATAVGPRLALDDFVLGLMARGTPHLAGTAQGTFDLFTFTTGRAADNAELMSRGLLLPWWTDPDLKIAFFRPLSSLTHRLDFALVPDTPAAMYLHSLLWLGASVVAVAVLLRAVEGATVIAGLATFLYALDDARGPVVSWLSNRNALLATSLAALAVAAHVRFRREGRLAYAVLSPLFLLLGLLSGELALGALAYIAAFALVLDRAGLRSRALSLLPSLGVLVAWRAAYSSAGFGARGSGAYLDPTAQPLAFAAELPVRLGALLHGQFGAPPSDLLFLGPPEHVPLFLALVVVTLVALGFVAWPILRSDATARFWALGALLSAVPVSASFSSDRLLPLVAIGGAALIARVVLACVAALRQGSRNFRTLVGLGFCGLHAVVAPLLLPLRAGQMQLLAATSDAGAQVLEGIGEIEKKTLLVLNAPVTLFATYLQPERAWLERPMAEHIYLLATAGTPITVTGEASALRVRPDGGFLYTPLDRHYRASPAGLGPGSHVRLPRLDAEVLEVTADGRPAEVRFRLDGEDPGRYELLVWQEGRYAARSLPSQGETLTLPALDLGQILLSSSLKNP